MRQPDKFVMIGLIVQAMLLSACTEKPGQDQAVRDNPATPEEIAIRTVSDLLGIAPQDAQIVSIAPREFSDSSLACPEPGRSYLMVITPGHQAIVEADGRRFDVRIAGQSGKICYRRKPGRNTDRPSDQLPAGSATS